MEIIVVVIIIGTMAALALPQIGTVVERNRSVEGMTILTALMGSQTRYKFENGAFTGTMANLDITIPASSNFNVPTISDSDPIATISRNSATYAYTLSITSAGAVTCVPKPGLCNKLGY